MKFLVSLLIICICIIAGAFLETYMKFRREGYNKSNLDQVHNFFNESATVGVIWTTIICIFIIGIECLIRVVK